MAAARRIFKDALTLRDQRDQDVIAGRTGRRAIFSYSTCLSWLHALQQGRYDYVVTAQQGTSESAAAGWTRRYPGAREVRSSPPGTECVGEAWRWELGYSRDGKRGKLQITYGLVCSPEGRPVSVGVHAGNIVDPTSLQSAVGRVKDRFGIERVVFVGDRGIITEARVRTLKEQDVGFITALRLRRSRH